MESRIDGRSLRYQHRRGELLEAVAEYVLDNGVTSLTLRRVADSAGISHVTLQHHFGSREQLVNEIVDYLLDRTLIPQEAYPEGTPNPDLSMATRLRAMWAHITSPAGQRDIRLFLEVLLQGVFEESEYLPAVVRSNTHRLDLITANTISLGCPEGEARAFATLFLGTIRGLVIDLLATGERERLDDAFELALANVERDAASWASRDRTAPSLGQRIGAASSDRKPSLPAPSS